MTVKMGVEQAGRFKLMISGGKRGTIEYPWQKNLILDAGITRLLSTNGSVLQYISVGSGSTAPAVGQTQLVSKIAHTNRSASHSHGYDAEEGYGWTIFTCQFNQGQAAGNISELGVGWDGTNLWSRALVLDAEGNPTTITVLSDEFLTVRYELRSWYIVPAPHVIDYDYDGTPMSTTVTYIAPPRTSSSNGASAIYYRDTKPLSISTTAGNNTNSSWLSVDGNTVGIRIVAAVNQHTSGIGGIAGGGAIGGRPLPFTSGVNFCTFSPPIAKTNEFEVTITGTYTMSRRAE